MARPNLAGFAGNDFANMSEEDLIAAGGNNWGPADIGSRHELARNEFNRRRAAEQKQRDDYAGFMDNQVYAQSMANRQGAQKALQGFADWADTQSGDKADLPAVDDLVYSNLRNTAAGNLGPFDRATQAALMTDANTRAQAGADSQIARLQEQAASLGGNMSDPSYQAAIRQAQSQAQSNMQNQRNAIAMQAGQANFGARMQATGGLASLQGQLANQALANRQQLSGLKQAGTQARVQAYNMPIERPMNVQAAVNADQQAMPVQPGNYNMPTFSQWQSAQKPKQPQQTQMNFGGRR